MENEQKTKISFGLKSIQLKVILPLVIIFMFFGSYAVVDYFRLESAKNSVERMRNESLQAINIAQEMERNMLNIQRLYPEAAVTMDSEIFSALEVADDNFKSSVEELRNLYPQNSDEYDSLMELYERMYDAGRSFMFTITSTSTNEEIMASCNRFVELSEVIQDTVKAYVTNANAQIAMMQADIESDVSMLKLMVVLEFLVILAATIFDFYFSNSQVTSPIKTITDRLTKFARKDLTAEKIAYSSKDEIGQLASVSNDLQETLQKIVEELKISSMKKTRIKKHECIYKLCTGIPLCSKAGKSKETGCSRSLYRLYDFSRKCNGTFRSIWCYLLCTG